MRVGENLKVSQSIYKKMEKYIKIKTQEEELLSDIYDWLNKQGIDTQDDKFADAIAVRLGTNEFDNPDHFFEDVKRFIAGEDVGYG